MAPRANWKGFLRLSLVTCPVALYPATSDTEKVSFNQINRKTGHRTGQQIEVRIGDAAQEHGADCVADQRDVQQQRPFGVEDRALPIARSRCAERTLSRKVVTRIDRNRISPG